MKQESSTHSESSSNKAILVGVKLPEDLSSSGISLDELIGLATTAEYEPVAELTQRLTGINPKTFLGSGKVEELKQAVLHHSPEVVIFDEELSPRTKSRTGKSCEMSCD